MAATFLKRLGAGAGLLALSACAYATPYPAAFPEKNGAQMAPADAGRSDGCDEATADPGSATLVLRCLRSRGQAWDKNVGWRIDYQVASPVIAARALCASIYKEQRFSDHAPLTVDYE